MANVVIGYTGNVCSTPMIEYARITRDVFVPVREDFDAYVFAAHASDPADPCRDLARVLDALFARESSAYMERPALVAYRGGPSIPPVADKPHLLFKWRCFDAALPGRGALARVFAAHRVRPVVMVRASLIEQAIKVFLSETVYGGRHQQFVTGRMSATDYAAYLGEQGRVSVTIARSDLPGIERIARQFLYRTRQLIRGMRVYFPHADGPQRIVAERIFRPLIDRVAYDAALQALFPGAAPLASREDPAVRKGGLDLSNCTNPGRVMEAPELRGLERQYHAETGALEPLI